jgi:hypothetical protein
MAWQRSCERRLQLLEAHCPLAIAHRSSRAASGEDELRLGVCGGLPADADTPSSHGWSLVISEPSSSAGGLSLAIQWGWRTDNPCKNSNL